MTAPPRTGMAFLSHLGSGVFADVLRFRGVNIPERTAAGLLFRIRAVRLPAVSAVALLLTHMLASFLYHNRQRKENRSEEMFSLR